RADRRCRPARSGRRARTRRLAGAAAVPGGELARPRPRVASPVARPPAEAAVRVSLPGRRAPRPSAVAGPRARGRPVVSVASVVRGAERSVGSRASTTHSGGAGGGDRASSGREVAGAPVARGAFRCPRPGAGRPRSPAGGHGHAGGTTLGGAGGGGGRAAAG